MLYLTTHSTHFIYGYMDSGQQDYVFWVKYSVNQETKKNVLFNDALNTFYLPIYGVHHW